MSLQDDILDDIGDVYLDTSGGFAVSATLKRAGYSSTTISVIFDEPTQVENAATGEIEMTIPSAQAATSDITGTTHGDVLEIDGTEYEVLAILPDGLGMSRLELSRNTAGE